MLAASRDQPNVPTVERERRRQRVSFAIGYGALGFFTLVLLQFMQMFPPAFGPAVLGLLAVVAIALIRPTIALGAAIVLGVVGDAIIMPWWPATKNLSSAESILFVADGLTIKPVDIVLATLFAALIVNRLVATDPAPLRFGPLAVPAAAFLAAIVIGLVWGLGRGGDLRIAFFESTPLLYIPVVYFLAINLLTTFAHYRALTIGIFAALTLNSTVAWLQLDEIKAVVGESHSAFEHAASTHFNLAMLLVVAVTWYTAKRTWNRPLLVLSLIPIVYIYLDGERRAGVVALIVGGVVLMAVLYRRDPQKFLRTVPALLIVFVAYSAVFWNSTGQLGFPAQAVKTVVQPDAASSADARSDLYRDIENFNLNATVRSNPILGTGFGNPFLQPVPLPDITTIFEFADYIPHNTLLGIWIKTGILGFLSFVYMCALGLASGIRTAWRLQNPVNVAVVAVLTSFIPMTVILSFVEISLEPTTMILLGVALAVAAGADTLDGDEPEDPDSRGTPRVRLATADDPGTMAPFETSVGAPS
ncbi:MAG: O-antigen ligase family protein [Actinomycetota bacterium]